ncbi:nuclear transport factor 2 family protein [Sphingomonas sp.]|uniref:nuclear transport factor 2 family protein n=1 Tax=Sphingomonas sp. TaxID=28214 RepID=UPI002CBB92E3|nr:nuclear transport factor 2 family protein [Sphingomonas sp.]HTG38270.1 nuclear transport factor 2 family protein [Sphingomonas sp.]
MTVSSVDPATKLEVHELLSRYCWAVDHRDSGEWEQVFTIDARYRTASSGVLDGRAAIMAVPDTLHDKSGGNWRHHFTNIIVDRSESGRELRVRAFLTIRDCQDGAPVASADCVILARRTDHWRIADFEAASVCKGQGLPQARTETTQAALH